MRVDLIGDVLPWILSALSLYVAHASGELRRRAWIVGLVGQVGWTVWIVHAGAWGFAPLNVMLYVSYARNWLLWRRRGIGA